MIRSLIVCVGLAIPLLASCSGASTPIARLYATRAGGTGTDVTNGVSALASGGALVSGSFSGTATFGSHHPHERRQHRRLRRPHRRAGTGPGPNAPAAPTTTTPWA
jgi:hypothetical protein